VPLLRYTATINGFDSLVVTKLDVLDEFDQIPVCVGYRIDGKDVCGMPPTVAGIAKIEPVYEWVPGWNTSTFGLANYIHPKDTIGGPRRSSYARLISRGRSSVRQPSSYLFVVKLGFWFGRYDVGGFACILPCQAFVPPKYANFGQINNTTM
jgi:Adenylosuccinate synthetase